MIGGRGSVTGEVYWQNTASACTTTTGSFAIPITGLPALKNLFLRFSFPIAIIACGKNPLGATHMSLECYALLRDAASWTLLSAGTPLEVTNTNIVSFAYNSRVWIVDDSFPKVLDSLFRPTLFWDTAANPPVMTGNQTGGGGCATAVGDFGYLFGGAYSGFSAKRIYLKNLPMTVADPLSPKRQWETLADVPNQPAQVNSCAPLPFNKNQIMLELFHADTGITDTVVFDTFSNSYYPVGSSPDLTGSTLIQMCNNPNNLFAFPTGTGSRQYNPAGPTIWTDSTAKTPLSTTRVNSAVVLVTADFFAAFTCTGC